MTGTRWFGLIGLCVVGLFLANAFRSSEFPGRHPWTWYDRDTDPNGFWIAALGWSAFAAFCLLLLLIG